MNKRIKIKKEKLINRTKINNILKELKFKITKQVFGNGYFVFTFKESSVCWFWLIELPGCKFGLWLNENNTYSIFGEHTLMIDKFKPSASYISFETIEEFNNELNLVLNKDEQHLEYLESIEETKIYENKKFQYILNYILDFNNFIKEFDKRNNYNVVLELKDFGCHRSPRFEFYIKYISPKYYFTKEQELELYFELSKIKEKNFDIESADDFMEESFIADFCNIRQVIYSENEFLYNKNRYNWTRYNNLIEFALN